MRAWIFAFVLTSIPAWSVGAVELPVGDAPAPVVSPHFPDRVSAFVWRNWSLVPVERMARTINAQPADVIALGRRMGLGEPPVISDDRWRRSHITIIRRNWHLLPYEQLLTLPDWTPERMAYTLREDDFLFHKLGGRKPRCERLTYRVPDEAACERLDHIARVVSEEFDGGLTEPREPLFDFVRQLSAPLKPTEQAGKRGDAANDSLFQPRFCYSYFALYGDPLLETSLDPYPDGYLARLSATGVDGVWLQGVLYKLAPFPFEPELSEGYETRLANLRQLCRRARARGIGVYLYLNEPRAMPLAFFEKHPELKGVTEGDYAALCTSVPAVQAYLVEAVASVCRAVPELAGFFTISGSENLTNCWSHYQGAQCPRCGPRGAGEVIGELHRLIQQGIDKAGSDARLIAWDWGWVEAIKPAEIIAQLPARADLMSVSEWELPVTRGGIDTVVGEYSISVVGPGPRAGRHWGYARARGMRTLAKIQAGNTWEMSAVPYIPALANVARHVGNLREAGVDGLMLGWTLGGYPSPNLAVVAEMSQPSQPSPADALRTVARKQFGPRIGPAVATAWEAFSEAFSQFPYHQGLLYVAPQQMGPANPLWAEPTGYKATMVGLPYDDLRSWRAVFPEEVFIGQFETMARGFDDAIAPLKELHRSLPVPGVPSAEGAALGREIDVADVCAIHFASVANQARFVQARDLLAKATSADQAGPLLDDLERLLHSEMELAKRLYTIQCRDSRIGFEATNQYYYVPLDLAEKVINCRYLRDDWLPAQRARWR